MAIKKFCQVGLFSICLLLACPGFAQTYTLNGEVLQINTNFHSIQGKPSWLIILRDVDSGQVYPYLYDVRHKNNFWIAFALSHRYRIVASTLQFGSHSEIQNFCGIETRLVSDQSMFIVVNGDLTADSRTSYCHVQPYTSYELPIADKV